MEIYSPEEYWQQRLQKDFTLSGVGHAELGHWYNHLLYRAKRRCLKSILRKCNVSLKNATVCDVGCGTGFYVDFFLNHGAAAVTGIDITPASIQYLQNKYPQQTFLQANIADQLPETLHNRFDLVSAFDVLYHITNDDQFRQAVHDLAQLLRPGGHLFFTSLLPEKTIQTVSHVRHRSRQHIADTIHDAGLTWRYAQPLFWRLNRPPFLSRLGPKHKKLARHLDSLLTPALYPLDCLLRPYGRDNLHLIAAQKPLTPQ